MGVEPPTSLSRAGISSRPLEYEPSWIQAPFDSYEGLTQQQFQESTAPFLKGGTEVPKTVPPGWRRVEGSQPGKFFYVHVPSQTIRPTPSDIYNCKDDCWISQDGTRLEEPGEAFTHPEFRTPSTASTSSSKAPEKVEASAGYQVAPDMPVTKVEPLPVGLLFPGQGSQYVKMMATVKELPKVKEMLATSQGILGFDLLDLCLNGPESRLEQTRFCQPAMYLAGLAGLEKLRVEKPEVVERCQSVAGLSLGEYTALTAAGVMDLETGLKVVKLRGEAMQEAAEMSKQMMLSVAGLSKERLDELCRESCEGANEVCQVANFLFPKGFSCAGSAAAIERLMDKAKSEEGCLQAKLLKTSGGFHTSLMAPAREKLLAALREAEPKMKPPRCDIYLNFTGRRIAAGTHPSEIIPQLADQLVNCVLWEPSMREMIKDGVTDFYECGPMKQLKSMMKRIDAEAFAKTTAVDV